MQFFHDQIEIALWKTNVEIEFALKDNTYFMDTN